jgi:hypothetical protein
MRSFRSAGRRGQDNRAELHHREHGVPQLDLVVQHDDVVAPPHAVVRQERGGLIGPACHLVEENFCSLPSSSTIHNATLPLPRPIASNQSIAQLNRSPKSGQRNSRTARA